MDTFNMDDFTALNFDSEFENFLGLGDGLPASRSAGNQVDQGTGITASTSGASSQHGRQAQTYGSENIISPQCPACRKYQADIDRLDQDHRLNFRMLKQKVTGTDLLIRRFKSMRDEYELQGKTIQNLNLQLEKVTRDSTILSEQLQSVMKEVKPLKDKNEHLLNELEKKNIDNERLLDRIQAEEAYKCQKSFLDERNRTLEAEATVLRRQNNTLSSRVHTLEINTKELDRERKALKSTGNIYVKRMENLALALYKAQTILDSLWKRFSYYDGIVEGETKPDLIPKNFKALVRKAVKDHGYKYAAQDHQLSRDNSRDNSQDNSQENSQDNVCDARPPSDDSDVSEFEDIDAVDDQGFDAIQNKDTKKSLVSPDQSFNKDKEQRLTKPTGPTSNGESIKRASGAKIPGKQTADPLKTNERESCNSILNQNGSYKSQLASRHKSVADIDAQKTQPASGNKSVTNVDVNKELRENGLANPIKTVACENTDTKPGEGSQPATGTGVTGAIPQLAISTKTVRQLYTVVSAPHLKLPPKREVCKSANTKTSPSKVNGAPPSAKLEPKPVTLSPGSEFSSIEGKRRVPEIKVTRPDLTDDLNLSSDSLSSGSLSSCSEDEKRKDNMSSRVRKDNVSSRFRKDNVSSRVRKDNVSSRVRKDNVSSCGKRDASVSSKTWPDVKVSQSAKVSGFGAVTRRSSSKVDDAKSGKLNISSSFKSKECLSSTSSSHESDEATQRVSTMSTTDKNFLKSSSHELETSVQNGTPRTAVTGDSNTSSRDILSSCSSSDESDDEERPAVKKGSSKLKTIATHQSGGSSLLSRLSDDSDHGDGPAVKKVLVNMKNKVTSKKNQTLECKEDIVTAALKKTFKQRVAVAETHTTCSSVETKQNTRYVLRSHLKQNQTGGVVTHSVVTDCVAASSEQNQAVSSLTDSAAVTDSVVTDSVVAHNVVTDIVAVSSDLGLKDAAKSHNKNNNETVAYTVHKHQQPTIHVSILSHINELCDSFILHNTSVLSDLSDGPDSPNPDSLMEVCDIDDAPTDSGEMVLAVQPSKLVATKGMPTSALIATNGMQMIENILSKHDDNDITKCSNETVQIIDVNITDSSDDIVLSKEAYITNGSVETVQINSKDDSIANNSNDTVKTNSLGDAVQANSSGDISTVSQKLKRNASTGLTLEGVRMKSLPLSKSANPLTAEDPQVPPENSQTAEDPQVPPENPLTAEDPQVPPENSQTAEDPQVPPENPLTAEDPQVPPENSLTAEDPQVPPDIHPTVEDHQDPPEILLIAEDPQVPPENPLTDEDPQVPPEIPLTDKDTKVPPEIPLTDKNPQVPPEIPLTDKDPQVPPENPLTAEDPKVPPEIPLTDKNPQVPPENPLIAEDPQAPPDIPPTVEDPQVPPENPLTVKDPQAPPDIPPTAEHPQAPPENTLIAEDPQVPPADLVSTIDLPLEDPNSCGHTETTASSKLLDTPTNDHSASTFTETKTKMAPRFASLFVMSPDSAFTAVRSPQYVAKNPFSSDVKVPETNSENSHTNDNGCVKIAQQNLSGPKKRISHTLRSAVSSTKNKIPIGQITGEGEQTVRTKETFDKAPVSFQTSTVVPATNKGPSSTDNERNKLPEMFLHNICETLQLSTSKAPFLPFCQQQKHSQPKHPILKKRKLSFSQPTSPQPSDSLCDTSFGLGGGEQPTLSQIFNYFKRPRLLSPLPPSPVVVSEESCDSLVKFDCSTPADVIKVTPLAKAFEAANSHKSLSGSRPETAEAKSRPIATRTRRSSIVNKRSAEHKATPPARQQEVATKLSNKLMRAQADDDKLIPLGRSQRVSSNVKVKSLSHQMMEVNKLMQAKRNAAVSGKPMSQEAPRGVKRKMEVTKTDQGAVTKRKKLANINGFPNTFEAVMFDLKNFLEEPKSDVNLTIDAMLSRVVGGDGQGIWEVLPHVVVQYLATQTDKTMDLLLAACDKEEIIEQVFISEGERRLLDLLSALMKAYQDTDKSCMISVAWTAIFSQGVVLKPARVFLCRLFTSLCKAQADLEQARVLIYNIAWCGYLDLASLYMAIAGVWPEVFSHNHMTRQCAMSPVLDYLLRDTYKSNPKVLRQVQCVLQRLCSWDTRQATVEPEKLLKTLYEKLLYHSANAKNGLNTGYIFEVSKAIELLLIYQGAAWTMSNFTQRILLSLAMKWEHNGDTEKGPCPELVVAMIGVFRAVVAVQPLLGNGLKMISQIFERFIARKSTNMSVELAYVNALLEISPYNPEKCLDLLRKWQDNNKGKVPNQTFSNLLQVRTMLSQKSGRGRASKR